MKTALFWAITPPVVPETSVSIYHYSLRDSPEERSSRSVKDV